MTDITVDVAILGAGSAGLSAYREARKYTDHVVILDGGILGTTCARVGCMPSKLLIAAAEARHRADNVKPFGIVSEPTGVDGQAVMQRVREERDRFVGFVVKSIDDFNQKQIIRQHARFEDDNTLILDDGRRIKAAAIIIATGSSPSIPTSFQKAGDRLIVNDNIFEWDKLPESVAIIGAGVIGLELGQALHRLGVNIRLFGRNNKIGPLSDPDVTRYAAQLFANEFPVHLNVDTKINRDGEAVVVEWSGAENGQERFDFLLAATGRRPNVDSLGLENTSLTLNSRGVPDHDPLSMRVGTSTIFIAGDATSDLQILHEAADEGRIAGENAARFPDAYRRSRRTALGIVFSDPQIAVCGESYQALISRGCEFECGEVSFEDQGRARVMLLNKGLLRVYGEKGTGRLVGAEMIAPAAEHLGHLIAWSIESKLTVSDVLGRPFYHPVVEEGLRTALRDLNHRLGFGANPPQRCIDCGPGA